MFYIIKENQVELELVERGKEERQTLERERERERETKDERDGESERGRRERERERESKVEQCHWRTCDGITNNQIVKRQLVC